YAHLDFRDSYLSDKWSHACSARRIADHVGVEHVVYIGVRSYSREEREDLERLGLTYVSVFDVHERGIGASVERAVKAINRDKVRANPMERKGRDELWPPAEPRASPISSPLSIGEPEPRESRPRVPTRRRPRKSGSGARPTRGTGYHGSGMKFATDPRLARTFMCTPHLGAFPGVHGRRMAWAAEQSRRVPLRNPAVLQARHAHERRGVHRRNDGATAPAGSGARAGGERRHDAGHPRGGDGDAGYPLGLRLPDR